MIGEAKDGVDKPNCQGKYSFVLTQDEKWIDGYGEAIWFLKENDRKPSRFISE